MAQVVQLIKRRWVSDTPTNLLGRLMMPEYYLQSLAKRNDWMTYHLAEFQSEEGRSMPYVYLSSSTMANAENSTKVRVWMQGGVHGNEPAGDQALLALLGKMDTNTTWAASILEKVDILMLPRYNPDGVAYFQRYLATNQDPNRDHTKMNRQQTRDIKQLVFDFAPHVGVDCHEYSANRGYGADAGLVQAVDGQFSAMKSLNIHKDIRRLSENMFAPRISAAMESHGLRWSPYIVGTPETSPIEFIETDSLARIGDSSVALTQAIMFLTETRGIQLGGQHFQRRTATGLVMVEAILQTAADMAEEVYATVEKCIDEFIASDKDIVISDMPTETNSTWQFVELSTGDLVEVPITFYHNTPTQANLTRSRPEAYIFPRAWREVADRLRVYGLEVENIKSDFRGEVEALNITSSVLDTELYEGATLNTVSASVSTKEMFMPAGSFWVSTRQKNAAHAFVTLEPEGPDSFATFNIIPVTAGDEYPVYRVMASA